MGRGAVGAREEEREEEEPLRRWWEGGGLSDRTGKMPRPRPRSGRRGGDAGTSVPVASRPGTRRASRSDGSRRTCGADVRPGRAKGRDSSLALPGNPRLLPYLQPNVCVFSPFREREIFARPTSHFQMQQGDTAKAGAQASPIDRRAPTRPGGAHRLGRWDRAGSVAGLGALALLHPLPPWAPSEGRCRRLKADG